MSSEVTIKTIGFEGAHRVGKGVQMDLLAEELNSAGIPTLIVRGDGSRTGRGSTPGDPYSEWWMDVNGYLRNSDTDKSLWNHTSYRLARELLVYRDRVLPKIVREMDQRYGVLLVDRSILSRTMIPRELNPDARSIELYPEAARGYFGHQKGRKLNEYDVCPDIIIELVAPKEALLERIEPGDPKAEFRRRLIEDRYDWYLNAIQYIPEDLQARVYRVDSSLAIDEVQANIRSIVSSRLNI